MNWFGATGLVTVAKSTLKGAQKAIDKALDIKEEEENVDRIPTPEESPERTSNPSSQDLGSSSLWGSFTGSFFENPRPLTSPGDDSPISQQPKRSSVSRLLAAHGEELDSELSLGDDSSVWEGFSKTQLVVETCTTVKEEKSGDPPALQSSEEVKWRRKERSNEKSQNRNSNNRLSVVSSESDRRSSDSVEVIGSTSCTASPESDLPNSLSTSSLASSAGLRPVSASSPDSVDIIPESSDSHSASVEVLGSHGSSTSLYSPLDPSLDKIPSTSKELASPDSVEVVPEEEDDVSLADDSYASASASESTMTQATILEPHGQTSSAMESSTHFLESIDSAGQTDTVASRTDTSISSLVLDSSTDTIYSDHGSLGRSAMQLTLTTEYPQPSAKSSWTNLSLLSSSERSHSGSLESLATKDPANQPSKHIESNSRTFETYDTKLSSPELVPDISAEETIAGMTSTDSSGEGTLVESSSDDTIPGSDQQAHSTSGYVRNLLAEAMVDDSSQMRVNSPVSVESRSDGLRLGSEQTSGHTSGDELETTTSSDIEIISSPNGDGSSTTSRQSPAKHLHRAPHGPVDILKFSGKIKGHQREPSEASSGGSDDSHGSETDRLLKKLSEMSELLEARETKLLVLSRSHAELQESYQDMRSQLESAQQSRLMESRSLNEEFTRRLSALERKFQQAIRDKDVLQKQLEQSKSEMANQLNEHVGERDETIKELREEGEKLSRQQLQQSNLIKKLRAKEKESDSTMKSLRDQVDNLSGEVERLKRSLAAKEDVERSQIEAVHQLTARVKMQEGEIFSMKEQRDHFQRIAENAQAALDNTNKELLDARVREEGADQRVKEATQNVEETARAELEAALTAAQQHKRQIMVQMDSMREQLSQAEAKHCRRESELLERLESAERRSEELSQQLSDATRPLLRQLQTFQASSKTQQEAWERQERLLTDSLAEVQTQLQQVSDAERAAREELLTLRSKVSTQENKLIASVSASQNMQERIIQLQTEFERVSKLSEEGKGVFESERDELKRQLASLDHQLSVERAAVEAEKRRCLQLQEQLRERERTLERDKERDTDLGKRDSPLVVPSGHSSPTISFGRESISESVSSVAWPVFTDDAFETSSISGRNIYESVRLNHTTSVLEGLQSQLKLREGEVQQLQWELSRREAQRCALTAELSTLSVRADEQEIRLNSSLQLQEELSSQLSSLRTEYDALLQLYGEKLEETQELRLDLQDVKDMYKAQIDQLLKKEELSQISLKQGNTSEEQKMAP
ncbi:TATA element modulatory factor isoform X2 [Frankliniella occidentalis]|uniref:TATA element modulatory factor isoform X2 n=1 Tax=Frankliniella occidentalis TaxID=133901 RepID=A0A6J1SGD5_FRAOC|nr:TATA element modulatory factor isoform X2 [Frankliniella occidentalis]